MSDFRQKLYDKYISSHKSLNMEAEKNSAYEIKWYKAKYLPALNNFDKNCSILDIGCGSGKMLDYLRYEGYTNLEGIDLSEEQLEIATQRGLKVKKENVFEYFEKNTKKFKVIIALDFIEHFTKEENLILFEEIYKTLDTGGVLVIRTPNAQGLQPERIMYGDLTHLCFFTPISLNQLAKVTGFSRCEYLETSPIINHIFGFPRVFMWSIVKFYANFFKKLEGATTQSIYTENFIGYLYK